MLKTKPKEVKEEEKVRKKGKKIKQETVSCKKARNLKTEPKKQKKKYQNYFEEGKEKKDIGTERVLLTGAGTDTDAKRVSEKNFFFESA